MSVIFINPYVFGGVLWTPANITTALWLDAADASTVTLESGAVSQWNDKSGNGRNLIQGNALAQPTYNLASLNGLNTLSFDGTNDTMASVSSTLPTGNSARSMLVVYKPNRTSATNAIAGQSLNTSSSSYFSLHFRVTPAGDPYFAGFGNDLTDSAAISLDPKIAGVTHDGVTTTLFRNATQIAQGPKTLNTNSGIFRVGSSIGSIEFAQMLVAEIVFVSASISALNRQQLEGYLAHKWGLTASLPNDHPYKSVAPTV
jgi:hypothetical protein